ncbi:MAG: 3-carboxy-cis,cis-muconate cycloisomerase [Azospirillaceae bacterium]|nr:3-carboxy-cis,cis-muconate cycloisomerase [Azospirillaceae bacterium]
MPSLLGALVGDCEIEALFSDEADLAAMLRTEAALAAAEAEAGLVSVEAAARIAAVCAVFRPDRDDLAQGVARDGVVIPALIAQLRAAVGVPHADAVHRGATSQDIIDTSLILRLKPALDLLERRLDAIGTALATLGIAEGARPLLAHTRMQAALPFTVADKIATWAAPLMRHKARLAEIRPRLLVVQLGGPVGTRAELAGQGDAVTRALAGRLDLGAAPPWHSQRDAIVECGGWFALVSGTFGKIGQDIALLAQSEVGAVRIAGAGASSAMAHKRNPVAAEILVALARFNAGLSGTLQQALVHENERSGAAWTLEWMVLPPMAVTAGASLRMASRLLKELSFA